MRKWSVHGPISYTRALHEPGHLVTTLNPKPYSSFHCNYFPLSQCNPYIAQSPCPRCQQTLRPAMDPEARAFFLEAATAKLLIPFPCGSKDRITKYLLLQCTLSNLRGSKGGNIRILIGALNPEVTRGPIGTMIGIYFLTFP